MIRYRTSLTDLQTRIDKQKATWRTRAARATKYFDSTGCYSEYDRNNNPLAPRPFWSEIKQVYLDIQRRKCAYCERCPSSWAGDYAIEHFRPKSTVDDWPPSSHPTHTHFIFASSGISSQGYYQLAYHPLNYTAACSQCNTNLKRNFFPVANPRDITATDPVALLASEQPYLIYPLGNHDTDPEQLIQFDGIIPGIKATYGSHGYKRAEVAIDIFCLEAREDLREERCRVLESLIDDLNDESTHPDAERRRKARNAIQRAQSPGSEHSSCAKCFIALYRRDPTRAERLAQEATKYLNSTIRRGLPPPRRRR